MRRLTQIEIATRLRLWADHLDLALLACTISTKDYERGIAEIIQWAEQESEKNHDQPS